LYISSLNADSRRAHEEFDQWRSTLPVDLGLDQLPALTFEDLPRLVEMIENVRSADNLQMVQF